MPHMSGPVNRHGKQQAENAAGKSAHGTAAKHGGTAHGLIVPEYFIVRAIVQCVSAFLTDPRLYASQSRRQTR